MPPAPYGTIRRLVSIGGAVVLESRQISPLARREPGSAQVPIALAGSVCLMLSVAFRAAYRLDTAAQAENVSLAQE